MTIWFKFEIKIYKRTVMCFIRMFWSTCTCMFLYFTEKNFLLFIENSKQICCFFVLLCELYVTCIIIFYMLNILPAVVHKTLICSFFMQECIPHNFYSTCLKFELKAQWYFQWWCGVAVKTKCEDLNLPLANWMMIIWCVYIVLVFSICHKQSLNMQMKLC